MQRTESNSSDELLWVNVKKPTDIKNAGVMKQIRSHTQREVRRKERISKPKYISTGKRIIKGVDRPLISPTKSLPEEKLSIVVAKKEEPVEKRLLTAVEQRSRIQQSLQNFAAEAFSTPSPSLSFAVSSNDPVRLTQKIHRYLRLWQGDRASQLCGGSIHGHWEVWMPTVLTNSTMMYAQAFCAATHFEFWGGHPTTAHTWALKDQAVMEVNKNLGNPDFSQDNSNVAAVLCLALASHVEVSRIIPRLKITINQILREQNSGKVNCMAHLNGLQKIIDMRGGWKRTPSTEVLSDLLDMADFVSAIIYNTGLTYTPSGTRDFGLQIDEDLKSPLNPSSVFIDQSDRGDFSTEAFHTLAHMQQLSILFEDFHATSSLGVFGLNGMENFARILQPSSIPYSYEQSNSSSSSPIEPSTTRSFSATASSPGSQSSAPYPGSRAANHMKEYLDEAIRLAGWIFYRTLVRNLHFDNEANLEDARKLKHYLDATAVTGWTEQPGPLLWVLLVATTALRSQPEGFTVSGHLSTTVLCVGVRNWMPVRRLLEKFMLIERLVVQNAYNASLCGNSSGGSPTSASVSSTFSRTGRRTTSESDVIDEEHLEGEVFETFKPVDRSFQNNFFVPEGITVQV